jgi:copper chaperone CopZ
VRTRFLILLIATLPMVACDQASDPAANSPAVAELTTVHFQVSGMTCGGCEQAITQALLLQDDVHEAGADHQAGTAWARVGPGAADPGVLAAVIDTLGYDASVTRPEP